MRENCIICEAKILRQKTGKYKINRGKRAVTCSSKCSKIFTRVASYIRNNSKKYLYI